MKTILLVVPIMLLCTVAWADCGNTEDCIKEGTFGLGKVNGSTRAIYYKLDETNELLKELIKEVRENNGIFHCEFQQRGQAEN